MFLCKLLLVDCNKGEKYRQMGKFVLCNYFNRLGYLFLLENWWKIGRCPNASLPRLVPTALIQTSTRRLRDSDQPLSLGKSHGDYRVFQVETSRSWTYTVY